MTSEKFEELVLKVKQDGTAIRADNSVFRDSSDLIHGSKELSSFLKTIAKVALQKDPVLLLCDPVEYKMTLIALTIFAFELGKRYGQEELVSETLEKVQ